MQSEITYEHQDKVKVLLMTTRKTSKINHIAQIPALLIKLVILI